MKSTVELPDELFRAAKALAASRGTSFRSLLIEALKRVVIESNSSASVSKDPPWMKCFGRFKDEAEDNSLLREVVKSEFSKIDEKSWK